MFSKERSFKIGILAAVILIAVCFVAIPILAQETAKPAPIEKSLKPPAKGILDGKIFIGQMAEKGEKDKSFDEVITFSASMFHSSACEMMGYGKAPYKAKKEGNAIGFQVKAANMDKTITTVLEWKGTVINDKASRSAKLIATAMLMQDGKSVKEYNVTADLEIEDTPTPTK